MTPSDAFDRLRSTGAFVEAVSNCHVHWYWHELNNGFKCMASRNLDGTGAPTIHYAFHIDDKPLRQKLYF